jgi:plasmid stabilization system protein ParE
MEVIVAPKARGDIASILAWTEEHFGPLARELVSKRWFLALLGLDSEQL